MNLPPLFSIAYLPPVEYFALMARNESVLIEDAEHFQKQSYRSRCSILTANGVETLSIPVSHDQHKMLIRDLKIDYKTEWQRNHWRAIESAYSNSPYFLYYKDFLYPYYHKHYTYLFDYNMELISLFLKLLGIKCTIGFSSSFQKEYPGEDYRNLIHPKRMKESEYPFQLKESYSQVFEDKFAFAANLSIVDLLFNQGNVAAQYLLLK